MKKRAKPKAVWLKVAEDGHPFAVQPDRVTDEDGAVGKASRVGAVFYLPASGSAEAKLKVAVRALKRIIRNCWGREASGGDMTAIQGCDYHEHNLHSIANRYLARIEKMGRGR